MGGNDGRPSRGLALRARCPTLELGRRWWQGRRGRTDEREEAGRGNGGDGAGEGEEEEEEGRWEATTGVRCVGSCCALAATVAAAGARADRRAGGVKGGGAAAAGAVEWAMVWRGGGAVGGDDGRPSRRLALAALRRMRPCGGGG